MSEIDDILEDIGIKASDKEVCANCCKIFIPKKLTQKYCTIKCRNSSYSVIYNKSKNKAQEKWRNKNKNKIKSYNSKYMRSNSESIKLKKYGLTLEQYVEIKNRQDNKCAICKKEEKLHIDHCHKTGRVRELLCPRCNKTIGMCKEDIQILENSIAYLKKWNN